MQYILVGLNTSELGPMPVTGDRGSDAHSPHLLPAAVWAPLSNSTASMPTSKQASGPDLCPEPAPNCPEDHPDSHAPPLFATHESSKVGRDRRPRPRAPSPTKHWGSGNSASHLMRSSGGTVLAPPPTNHCVNVQIEFE